MAGCRVLRDAPDTRDVSLIDNIEAVTRQKGSYFHFLWEMSILFP